MMSKKAPLFFVCTVLVMSVSMSGCAYHKTRMLSQMEPEEKYYQVKLQRAPSGSANYMTERLATVQSAKPPQESPPPQDKRVLPPEHKMPIPSRMMIMNGDMRLEVKTFAPVYERILAAAKEMGGYVSSSSSWQNSETGAKSGTITLRVPSRHFDRVLDEVGKLGMVTSKEVKGNDVTEEFVDLKSRLKNYNAEEQQYLIVMKKAVRIPDILAVERELGRIRGEIEHITGRMKYIMAMVDYSTLTVSIYERMSPTLPLSFWDFPKTVRNAVSAFLTVVISIVRAGIWIVVFSPFLMASFLLRWLYAKRRK